MAIAAAWWRGAHGAWRIARAGATSLRRRSDRTGDL